MDATKLAQDAMVALGPYGDPRAREALVHATVVLERDVQRWTSSEGTVHGHRVRVRVDARSLGVVRAHPAAEDALQAAFARAIAALPGQSLVDFVIEWNGAVVTLVTSYRGEVLRSDTNDFAQALFAYLDGAGEHDTAQRLLALQLTCIGRDAVVIEGDVDEATLAVLRGATKALLGERARVTSC